MLRKKRILRLVSMNLGKQQNAGRRPRKEPPQADPVLSEQDEPALAVAKPEPNDQQPALAAVTVDLESASPAELVELARNPEMLEAVYAEVYRRLQDDPRRANFLVFRFLSSPEEADRTDAYDGLRAMGWNAAKKRRALDPRCLADTGRIVSWAGAMPERARPFKRDGVESTKDSIRTELVNQLHPFQKLSFADKVGTALSHGFDRVVEEAANEVRRQHRQATKTNPIPGTAGVLDRTTESGNSFEPGEYKDLLVFCEPEFTEEVGKQGYVILLAFLATVNNWPDDVRGQQRAATEVIQAVCGVKPRRAQQIKRQLMAGIEAAVRKDSPVFRAIYQLLWSKVPRQRSTFDAALSFEAALQGDGFDGHPDNWDAANSTVDRNELITQD